MSGPGADFTVELALFTGPFRLLADLLLDQKMDVCDVAVADVTTAFLDRGSREMGRWDLDESTWFLAVCALLLELKVGRLLPRTARPGAEEDLIGDVSPDLLYARSRELAAFRQVALTMAEVMAGAALMVPRTGAPPPEFADLYPDVMERVTPESLARTAAHVLAPAPDLDLSHVTPIRVTLGEAIDAVKRHLNMSDRASFRELLVDCEERIDVVVRFLALLELYREGEIDIRQAGLFGDIEVRRVGVVGWRSPSGTGHGAEARSDVQGFAGDRSPPATEADRTSSGSADDWEGEPNDG